MRFLLGGLCGLSLRAAALITAAVVGIMPAPAYAHAVIVASEPAPGERLAVAPGAVFLSFSEPISTRLSRATVTGPTGQAFKSASSGSTGLVVPLLTDTPGIYDVAWTTVSILDGHTLSGTFRFGVRADVIGGSAADTASGPQAADLAVAIPRALEYGSLLTAVGMLLLGYLAGRPPAFGWLTLRLAVPIGLALTSGLAVVVGESLLASPNVSLSAVPDYLSAGAPGIARLLRLLAENAALFFAYARSPRLALIPLLLAVVALAAAGHAAAVQPAWWGIAVDSAHLIATGLWAGGILALATIRPPGGWRGAEARRLLARFSPLALVAFAASVTFGVLRSVQELSTIGDLFYSTYGQVLSAKVLGVAVMTGLSVLAWQRAVAPRIEAGAAAFVIGAAALLAAFPLPPARLSAADAALAAAAPSLAFPQPGDLTMASTAGDTLVGLTLRPGSPGPNELWIYVLPKEGGSGAGNVPVGLSVDGVPLAGQRCGPTCRSATADLQGGEQVDVNIGAGHGPAAFELPPFLRAPDGSALLDKMRSKMDALQSLRIDETLGPANPPVQARYALQAPDRLRQDVGSGASLIWIGSTRYLKDSPNGRWQTEDTGFALPIPAFSWDPPGVREFVAPRVLGESTVDGVDTQVVSFFAKSGSLPVWFRLWIDREGLAHRAEMRAAGHFMDHRYADFDGDVEITPPPGVLGTP